MKNFFIILFIAVLEIIICFPFSIFIINKVRAEEITVFINEFLPDADGSDSGKEWVEIYNLSTVQVNLKDWKISTKTTSTPRNTILPDVIIQPQSYFVISEFDLEQGIAGVNVGAGKLNMYNSNAQIYLTNNNGDIIDSLDYQDTSEGKSLERRGPISSEFCSQLQITDINTIGLSNYNLDSNCWPELNNSPIDFPEVPENPPETAMGKQSNILISEGYPSPNKNLNETEWLEIYNQDISTVDISGMYLKERSSNGEIGTTKTMLPFTTLSSGSYLVIYENDLKLSLNNSGDSIFLFDANDTIVDNFKYDSTATSLSVSRKFINNSYQKIYNFDESKNFVPTTSIATPGSINNFPLPKSMLISDKDKIKKDSYVSLEGIVISEIGLISNYSFFIQDQSSGIKIVLNFENKETFSLNVGDIIKVVGYYRVPSSSPVYIEVNNSSDLEITKKNQEVSIINVRDMGNLESSLGSLVYFKSDISKNYGTTFYLSYNSGSIKVKINSNSKITLQEKTKGDIVEVTGVLIKDGDYFTIIPRYPSDVQIFSISENDPNSKQAENLKTTTLLAGSILGESELSDSVNFQPASYPNVGDKIYYLDHSIDSEGKIYPWPIYLASSGISLVEIAKLLSKLVKFL